MSTTGQTANDQTANDQTANERTANDRATNGHGLALDHTAAVPAGSTAPDAPLLLLLHGFGSNEHDLVGLVPALQPASGPGFAAVSLRAPLVAFPGARGQFAWAPIQAPGEPDPAPVEAATWAVLDWLDVHVEPSRAVVPLGFSQGGLMVTQLLRARPGRFAGGVVLSGFSLGGEQPGDAALAERRPPAFFGRGPLDQVIPAAAFARTHAFLAATTALRDVVYPGLAHGVGQQEVADVAAFLAALDLTPR